MFFGTSHQLKTLTPFAIAHLFCASPDGLRNLEFSMGGTYKYRDIFARFIIMQEKPILARVIDTSQRIGDNHAFI